MFGNVVRLTTWLNKIIVAIELIMVEDSGKKGGEKKFLVEEKFLPINLSRSFLPSVPRRIEEDRFDASRVPETESKRNLVAPLNFIGGFLFRGID